MAVLFRLLSLPMLTLAAAIQWLLALILAPDRVDSYSHLWFMASILLLNYSFGIVFWLLLYPLLFNPLRHLPGPRVSASKASCEAQASINGNLGPCFNAPGLIGYS